LESAFGYQTRSQFDPKLVKGQANCPVTCSLRVNRSTADETNAHIASFSSEAGAGAITYDASLGPYDGKKVKMEVSCVNPLNAFNIATTDFTVTYRNKYCNPVIHQESAEISNVYLEWGTSAITKTISPFAVSSDCEGVEF
jgi:hypothetical protein